MRNGDHNPTATRYGPPAARLPTFSPRAIIFHGDADPTVHPANGETLFQQTCISQLLTTNERLSGTEGGVSYTRRNAATPQGEVRAELWEIHGAGHAWSGGDPRGTYANSRGPSASREMLRFFLETPGWK
jgi:poly(3-hydroxybutyrate) depolymerase